MPPSDGSLVPQGAARQENHSPASSGELTFSRIAHFFNATLPGQTHSKGWTPPSVSELQEFLPQYRIEALIACGGMGAVYHGRQPALDREVAIKILPPALIERDPSFLVRFQQEARLMARLHHPSIVSVFEAGESADGVLFIVMEFMPGGDVAQLVASQGAVPVENAIQITRSICHALGAAHQIGVLHRDIKPSNILLDAAGNAKVADFGLATLHTPNSERVTGLNIVVGTPEFMAPECREPNASVDHRADLYAVGCMLYYMLTGKLPHGRFEPASALVPNLNKRLDSLLNRTLQADPELRHQTADDLLADLERLGRRSIMSWVALASWTSLVAAVAGVSLWIMPKDALPPTATAHPTAKTKPVTAPTRNWSTPYKELIDLPKDPRLASAFVKDGPWFVPTSDAATIYTRLPLAKNRGIRAVFLRASAGENAGGLRFRDNTDGFGIVGPTYTCNLTPNGDHLLLYSWSSAPGQKLLTGAMLSNYALTAPVKAGEQYSLEATVINQVITVRFNGKIVAQVSDNRISTGSISLGAAEPFRDLEILDLDGLNQEEAMLHTNLEFTQGAAENIPPPSRSISNLLPFAKLPTTAGKVKVWRLDGSPVDESDKDAQAPNSSDVLNLALCTSPQEIEDRRYIAANLTGGRIAGWGDTDIDFNVSHPWQKGITQIIPTGKIAFGLNAIGRLTTFPDLRSSFDSIRNVTLCQVDFAQGLIFCLTRRGYLLQTDSKTEEITFADCPADIQGKIIQFWVADDGSQYAALTREQTLHSWGRTSQTEYANVSQIKDGGSALSVMFANGTWQIIGGPMQTGSPQPGVLEYHWATPSVAVAKLNGVWKAHGPVNLKTFEQHASACIQVIFNDRHAFGINATD